MAAMSNTTFLPNVSQLVRITASPKHPQSDNGKPKGQGRHERHEEEEQRAHRLPVDAEEQINAQRKLKNPHRHRADIGRELGRNLKQAPRL